MALSYADIQNRIEQFLQDTANATYDTTELGYAIENELKRLSGYSPYLLDVIFQIESRTGTDVTGTASTLTDSVKSQFLSTDPTKEKVIHNTTDDTWAVVLTYTSTSILTLSADIMDANESYEIYNKRCKNKRQIYIGDMPPFLWVESVEYPIGTQRNFFRFSKDIIELDVYDSTIRDSDSTLDTLERVNVLVKFAMPQTLCQLTDWAGALTADAVVGATTIAITDMGTTETIEAGEMFNLENHRTTYIVTTEVTMVNKAGNLVFYPALEAAASTADAITFIKSTLQPKHEDLLERMVVSRAVQSDMIRHINAIPTGGAMTMRNYQQWITGNPLLNPALLNRELESLATPRMAKILPKGAVN